MDGIVDNKYNTNDNKIEVTRCELTIVQEGNTIGTTSDYEKLTLEFEYPLGAKDGPFIVLKTDGWSIDNFDDFKNEMEDLIKNFDKMTNVKSILED